MKLFCVVLAPETTSGFGNQMYTIAQSIQNCIESTDNPCDLILFTSFLKEINSNEYCNLSDVVDINETNNALKNITNIQIEDLNLANLSILKATVGINNFLLDITPSITEFLKNDNSFFLPVTYNFNAYCDSLVKEAHNKYYVSLDKKTFKLTISYKINNTIVNKCYDIINGHLKEALEIDIKTPQMNIINICTRHDDNFYYVKQNIVFNKHFSYAVDEFIKGYIEGNNKNNKNQKINCIHLRLEDDAMEHWSKENKVEKSIYKHIVENKYLREIQNHIKKDELTLILAHNYDNNVIKYLKETGYNYLTTPSWSNYRDISAIYDCIVGESCNNIYICVWESSFSYLLGYRIKKNLDPKNFITIVYNNISNEELESHSKSI
jgi:hypothetical protein